MGRELSEKEKIQVLEKQEQSRIAFAAVKDAMQLVDLTQNKNITYNTYSKDKLRTMMKNPASEANQKGLRKLSNFLYTVSHVYRRLINFKALQVNMKSWVAYPKISSIEEVDKESVLANYDKVINYVKNMNLKSQILKIMLNLWLNDVCYIFTYGDPSDDEDGFFIHILDPDYCKISGQDYYSGVLHIAFDFSFFDGANSFYLDVYDPIFKKLYNKYKNDSKLRWQELPVERSTAFKVNIQNLDFPIPPLSGLFEPIIDLTDLQGIQNVKDEMEIFKLIYAKIDTLKGATTPDDFEIDLDLAVEFYNKIKESLPDNVGVALSPMKLDSIDFQSNTANDTNMISNAYSNVVDAFGGIVLNGNRITSSTAFKMALKFDTMDSTALVEQFNTWVNFYILKNVGNTGIQVEFDDTSPFFLDDKIEKMSKIAMYSVPIKMELYSLVGGNPIKERGMTFLEEALGITKTSWDCPLVSSNVQSGKNGDGSEGAPKKDEGDLSDEGVDTRDKNKNNN